MYYKYILPLRLVANAVDGLGMRDSFRVNRGARRHQARKIPGRGGDFKSEMVELWLAFTYFDTFAAGFIVK
jgi:hypothetical protein